MAWAGGNFTRIYGTGGWANDASSGTGIEPGRHDTQDNDLADGITACINKDGSNAMTGNLNLGNNRPININAGNAAAPAVCVGGDTNTGIFGPAADTWAVATNGTERVKVDPNGNIAIGGGNSAGRIKNLYNTSAPNQTYTILSQNWDYVTNTADAALNGTAAISIEGGASNYSAIRFHTGLNNAQPTEKAIITQTGNVGIGQPSPSSKLEVIGNTLLAPNTSTTAGNTYHEIRMIGTADGSPNSIRIGAEGTAFNGVGYIDTLKGGVANNTPLSIRAGSVERIKITPTASIEVRGPGFAYPDSAAYVGGSSNSVGFAWKSPDIYGTVDNVVNAIVGTVSDYRLKHNFTPVTSALSKILSLKIGTYNPKELTGEIINKTNCGVLAHEASDIFPDLVVGEKDKVSENGAPMYQSFNYAGLAPYLVVAIKELHAEVESLKTQLAAKTETL